MTQFDFPPSRCTDSCVVINRRNATQWMEALMANGTNYLTNFRFAQYCQALNKIFNSGKRVLSSGLDFLEIGPAVHEGEVICHVFVMSCCRSVSGTI